MPLVAHSNLPTFQRLIREGRNILPPDRAAHQDIRELHIGLLNMMPDAALEATERQFLRLIGESNQIAQIYVHLFTLPNVRRGEKAQKHIKQYYKPFEVLQEEGLDALIISGANEETNPNVSNSGFWAPLKDALDWAYDNVASTLCSCLTTHAVMQFRHGVERQFRGSKLTGIYKHRVHNRAHPVVASMNTVFDVPHSRFNEITEDQFRQAGMNILVSSEEAGVHMATSADNFRLICLQGHPEYDTVSLLKEYKRDVELYLRGEMEYPPMPEHYFNDKTRALLNTYLDQAKPGADNPPFPEEDIIPLLENTWRDSGRSVIGNWIGKVYQTTNVDRKKQFMDGIDPDDPLGLKQARST